ncbi:MAG: archaemetzincin family Zn-dependent metalloprotease [Syntrophaceae bacterium]|nr:archaemetzincin family Zn-dependent metalloprotease [Syntrophaceae bacterium]
MDTLLVPIGDVDPKVIETLRHDLARAFKKKILLARGMPQPDYAFNRRRNQYLSTAILKAMAEKKAYSIYEKVLGIIDHDLYVPRLNFVFGEAGRDVAIISLTRLRNEFYNLPKDLPLFRKRVLTEAVHELGHTYGLGHCGNPHCVMFFSNSLIDTDAKGPDFCARCKAKLPDQT